MPLIDKLRALLDEEPDGEDLDPVDEIEAGVDEVVNADPADDDPTDGSPLTGSVDGDPVDGDPADEDEIESAGEAEAPEVAELRQQVLDLAAENETLRNRLAAAGLEDEITDDAIEEIDEVDDTIEDDVVEAFNTDYAAQQAYLASITKD